MNMDEKMKLEFKVIWSEEDEEYIGLCPEFESLSFLSSTKKGAMIGIMGLVMKILEDQIYNAKPVIACVTCGKKGCNKFWHRQIKFDSTGEYERYKGLKSSKHIKDLQVHVPFSLYGAEPYFFRCGRVYIGKITVDFVYYDKRKKKKVIEDYKGGAELTEAFKLRWKLLQSYYVRYDFLITNKPLEGL